MPLVRGTPADSLGFGSVDYGASLNHSSLVCAAGWYEGIAPIKQREPTDETRRLSFLADR